MKVVIAGGGSVGTSIALDLTDRHHDVTLMEQNSDRAERLKTMMPGVPVRARLGKNRVALRGGGRDREILEFASQRNGPET